MCAGEIDGVIGPITEGAIDAFRHQVNESASAQLAIGTAFGEPDWRAVASLYDAKLADVLDKTAADLAGLRDAIVWCSPKLLGYGEAWPRDRVWPERIDDASPADVSDRRAELLVVPAGLDLAAILGNDLTQLYASRWLRFHALPRRGAPFDLVVRLVPDHHPSADVSDTLVLESMRGTVHRRELMADCTDCTDYLETVFERLDPTDVYSLYVECPGVPRPHVIFETMRGFALRGRTLDPPSPDADDEPFVPDDDPSTVRDPDENEHAEEEPHA